MKLLLVDDNRELSSWLMRLLEQSGYAVEQAFTGEEANHFLVTQTYDAILLDLTLPGIKGQAVLKTLRAKDNQVPVLIISALDALTDVIENLNLGADDYLAKPFDIQELEARLRSLLRRASGKANPLLHCAGLSYDSNSKLFASHGKALNLPPREHAVLEALIRKSGKTVSKIDLTDGLFPLDDSVTTHALEIYIVRLRKKLEHSGAQILTLRGLGYMLSYVATE
ncbi:MULTISPECIES: response regulator [unclassified Undibacterium]|uniref:response regulator n=1 Tax=unclassified Undibacterium TaxID=2630295 RepID=UPI002AC950EC|nr:MULTISPECIES: response regulator [unclassified Undibacterium]MEB0140640.1 response regulator [Undibacterium sp. CCC2.1]MEB0173669.1 response regulator [Undibacterium sp. CCC1.1]MEB0177653.1 response regulator [Undibacterium sp. CCC3.4]MEB0216830.1 response regulator [Undibacterium sp. 5I2]WPX41926.1 response regulator [Undibacterium sp. CCC3.4]